MTSIFVAKLDFGVTNEQLRQLFEQHGSVIKVNVATDRETGKSRGFAFVEMTDREEAENAINALNGHMINGRDIAVKEAELKKSETCQIIIATYAMASEALDIKTLTTLILATPKTDIVQAVGRILRVKHARPLVVDIVDSHEVFLSQWQKRRKYYLQNQYTVMHTKSPLYVLDQWEQAGKTSKSACAAGTSVAGKTSKAGTSAAGKTSVAPSKAGASVAPSKAAVNPANLLANGVSAAAKYINTFGKIKQTYDEYM